MIFKVIITTTTVGEVLIDAATKEEAELVASAHIEEFKEEVQHMDYEAAPADMKDCRGRLINYLDEEQELKYYNL